MSSLDLFVSEESIERKEGASYFGFQTYIRYVIISVRFLQIGRCTSLGKSLNECSRLHRFCHLF